MSQSQPAGLLTDTSTVSHPQAVPLEPQLLKLGKKIKAGAEFIQTLDIYDLERSRPFFEHLKGKDVKVLAGVRLITDRHVRLSDEGKLPGNPIPEDIIEEIKGLEGEGEVVERSKKRMVDMITQVKDSGLCHGGHLTAEGHEDLIPQIIEEAGI